MADPKKLTVLQLLPALESGGVERGTLEIAQALVKQGHRALVMSAGGRLVESLVQSGAEHYTWPVGVKSVRTLLMAHRLRRFLIEHRVDILHARSRVPAWLAWLAWRGMDPATRPRFVTTVHGLYGVNRYSGIMTRGEAVIAVSDTVRAYILEHYSDTLPWRIHVIHRGVDGEAYPYGWKPDATWRAQFFAQFPAANDRTLITLPGRITRLKGHEDFIELIGRLKRRGLPVHGLIVGGATQSKQRYLQKLYYRVRSAGLTSDITFTGQRDDLKHILAISRLVLSLSSQPESFGRTTLEALRLGVPVAGYAHGGVGEILRTVYPDGLLPNDNFDASCQRIGQLLANPQPVPEGDFFPLQAMLDQTLALYEQLTRAPRIG
ncbi:MAG: glycosyl transferase [Thiobacillus sp. SCN 64-35]|nr:glycosyltransferase family 4 protein [Thiobacillus sp.]ODU14001.1 MAG: glycosyl transferase [Thiobacillus sp. SCN 64-35]ODU88497.1 MAG: glycosyl transferase [Thiobacillus sp. SCN 65-179]OJW36493.1 MAG: glycosyl transferase [Thiobacillus sp. 65-69]